MQVIWWDTRNLSEAVDRMYIDAARKNDPKTAEGGTCLEYDVTVVLQMRHLLFISLNIASTLHRLPLPSLRLS